MVLRHLAVATYALSYITISLAQEAPEFATEFRLNIIGYPDDSNDELAKAYMIKAQLRYTPDAHPILTNEGDHWVEYAETIAPYPDRPNEEYVLFAALRWTRPDPEAWTVRIWDNETKKIASVCNVTLDTDPMIPRLDWYIGWGLDFNNTMNEFGGDRSKFKIECEMDGDQPWIHGRTRQQSEELQQDG